MIIWYIQSSLDTLVPAVTKYLQKATTGRNSFTHHSRSQPGLWPHVSATAKKEVTSCSDPSLQGGAAHIHSCSSLLAKLFGEMPSQTSSKVPHLDN